MDIVPYYKFALKTALRAGKILLDHYSHDFRIAYKDKGNGKRNLVTEVDLLSEKFITEAIRKQFPTHAILTEEGTNSLVKKADFRWIIDPLDGTTNYAHGFPFYAVSIALEYKGKIVVGVVYAPHFDELFSAAKGYGALLNNQEMKVSKIKKLDEALLATGFAYSSRSTNLPYFEQMLNKAQEVRRPGSAALDLASIAAGRLDAYWEFNLMPWDVAAGKLLVEEAGGKVTMLDGSPLDLEGKNIAASNGLLHKSFLKNLHEVSVRGMLKKASKKVPFWS